MLELPAAEARTSQGYGTSDHLAVPDRQPTSTRSPNASADDLQALGYSTADIQLMIDGGNGYQGPRLAIDETGLWRSFMTMGE